MKRMLFILLIALAANSVFAQQFRATSFEIRDRKDLSFGGHNVGKLFITVDGGKRKIADQAGEAWIINNGKEVVYSGADGAGGFENVGESLRIYDVKTKKTRKILSEYSSVAGVTEVNLSTNQRVLLVRDSYGESDVLSVFVVDPKRGEVFRRAPAELIKVQGDFMTIGIDDPSLYDQADENNRTAFALPNSTKPKRTRTYDLKKLLKRKVIYNPKTP
jgi:hypothetical protein